MIHALAALALPTIWIVDANNGPGTNFTSLPAAVAAAQTGDTLIVRAGTYEAFYVTGKALTIRGDGAALTSVSLPTPGASAALPYQTVTVDNTPAGLPFFLSGLSLAAPSPAIATLQPLYPGLLVLSGATVVLADCRVTGPVQGAQSFRSGDAAAVRGTLHAVRTQFTANNASLIQTSAFQWTCVAGAGVVVAGGFFAADACVCNGGSATGLTSIISSATSGSGLVVNNGRATITRSSCYAGYNIAQSTQVPPVRTMGSGVEVNGGLARISGTAADVCTSTYGGDVPGAGVKVTAGAAVVHGPVTLAVGGFSLPIPTSGNVTFGPTMPTLTITSSTYPNGDTNASQPVTWSISAPVGGAGYVLLADVMPSFADLTGLPVLGEALVPLTGSANFFGVLDFLGHHAETFTPAQLIPNLLGVPMFLQAAMLEPALARVTSREIRVFR